MNYINKILTSSLLILLFFTLSSLTTTHDDDLVKKIKIEDLENIMNSENDTLYIINFWATWCKPCIEEIPYFEKIGKKYKDQNVKVLFVSVDYPKHYDSRVLPFVKKNKLNSQVVLLDEKDPNDWMRRISKDWQGSIPATMMVHGNSKTKKFFEQEFTYNQLNTEVNKIIK